jgi:hypothetical protein
LKQTRLAELLGVNQATVSGWLTGTAPCGELHLTRIVALLEALGPDQKETTLAELFHLRLRGRVSQDREDSGRWTPESRALAAAAANRLRPIYALATGHQSTGPRTLGHFPDAFYPLTVISGDKRESSISRINQADFGAVSASPAETRWIAQLRLRPDVEFLTDKIFMLEDVDQLRRRFAERNLLVIGSPGSNHLARRIHLSRPGGGWKRAAPIFRFNAPRGNLELIEEFLATLKPKHSDELLGVQAEERTQKALKNSLRFLFGGGIIDPTYEFKVRGQMLLPNVDFGLISLARNPFASDPRFVSVLAAGFHMFGTAHAIRMLSRPENFDEHPYGGVLRVSVNQSASFAVRFDESTAIWDTESTYSKEQLVEALEQLAVKGHPIINVDQEEFAETLKFVHEL